MTVNESINLNKAADHSTTRVFDDPGRRLKILHFDKFGKALFALCEPRRASLKTTPKIDIPSPSSSLDDRVGVSDFSDSDGDHGECSSGDDRFYSTATTTEKRRLELIRISVMTGVDLTVCKRFTVDPSSSSSSSLDDDSRNFGELTKIRLRDLAYCSSQDDDVLGVIYSREVISQRPPGSNSWTTTNCRRFFVTIDLERNCRTQVFELDGKDDQALTKQSQLKLLHLTGGVGWVLVQEDFDTENGCQFLTFYSMLTDGVSRKVKLTEMMTYATDNYYIVLSVDGSQIYMFQIGSNEVTIYDAANDTFLNSVRIPERSYHVFKIEQKSYLFPEFWKEPSMPKSHPTCLSMYDRGKWKKTDVTIDANDYQLAGSVKDVWVTGSNAGFLAVGSVSRSGRPRRQCVNAYHVSYLNKSKTIRTLRDLALEATVQCLHPGSLARSNLLPSNMFREYFGPEWQKRDSLTNDDVQIKLM